MTRRKGKTEVGDPPPQRSPHAATLPAWLDPEGNHGKMWVLLMRPADAKVTLPSNPFTLAKSVQATVGTITEAYRDKDGHIVLKVRGDEKVRKLQRLTELIDGTKVVVEEHPRLNLTKVVVTCNSVSEMSDEELKTEPSLQEQGVVDVRRFRKGGPAMVLTIRGTTAPENIFFGFDRCKTKPYVQAPMQCFRCFEFGHTKARCSAEQVCRNCSMPHQILKDSEGKTICDKPARCRHCNGPHSPASRTCELYKQEEAIERIRSTGKSPREARRLFEETQRQAQTSYASVAGTSVQNRLTAAQQTGESTLKKELAETQKALKHALEELAKLKAAGSNEETKPTKNDRTKKMASEAKPCKSAETTRTVKPTGTSPTSSDEMETENESESSGPRARRDSESSTISKRRLSESSDSSVATVVDSEEETTQTTNKPIPKPTKQNNATPKIPTGTGKPIKPTKKENTKRSKQ